MPEDFQPTEKDRIGEFPLEEWEILPNDTIQEWDLPEDSYKTPW